MPIPGTVPVSNPLAPTSVLDIYATHDEQWGKGGFRTVADATERDAITQSRRKAGMLVCTADDGVIWRLGDNLSTWEALSLGDYLVFADLTARDALPVGSRKDGLHAYVVATGKAYVLGADLTTWTEIPTAQDAQSAADRATRNMLLAFELFDDFERADVETGGNIGAPVTGGDDWVILGPGAINPATTVRLEDGALRMPPSGYLYYLVRQFEYQPTVMGAEISFEDHADGDPEEPGYGARAIFTLAVTTRENGSWVDNLVHCLISEQGMSIETGFHGGHLIRHAAIGFPAGLIVRGRKYKAELIFDGSLAILRLDRFYCVACDPRISRWHGQNGYWEAFYNDPTPAKNANEIAIHAVWTKRIATAPAYIPARTGFVPTTPARGLRFNGGASIATANLTGLGAIGTGDFTLWWRGRMPQQAYEIDLDAGQQMGLMSLSNQASGADWGNGIQLLIDHLTLYYPKLRVRLPAVAEYREKWYNEELPGQAFAKAIDLAVVRKGSAVELYADGAFIVTNWPDQVSASPPAWSASVASTYLHVGHKDTTYGQGFIGEIYQAGLANLPIPGDDMISLTRGVIPERLKWATNAAMSDGDVMRVGKCYRIGAVGTTDYWYTGCTAGDEIHVLSDTLAIDLRTSEGYTLNTLSANATNRATQLGFMVFLTGQEGDSVMRDMSENRRDAVLATTVRNTGPDVDLARGAISIPVADDEDHRPARGLMIATDEGKTAYMQVASGTRPLGAIIDGGVGATIATPVSDRLLLCNSGSIVKLRTAADAGDIVAGTPLSIDYGTAVYDTHVGAVRAASYGQVIVAVAMESAGDSSWVTAILTGTPFTGPLPPSYPVYWGKSENETVDYPTVLGTFATVNRPSASGSYDFVSGAGYAYLVFRADWTTPTSLKIGAFDLSLETTDPYDTEFGTLYCSTLNIGGVNHRVFRSDQLLNGDFTVTAA